MKFFNIALLVAVAAGVQLQGAGAGTAAAGGSAPPITAADIAAYASTTLWKKGAKKSPAEIQAGLVEEGFKADTAAAIVE